MSTSYGSICQEVEKYFKAKQEEPDRPWADPSGSYKKSLECGCQFCSIACEAFGKNENVHEFATSDNTGVSLEAYEYFDDRDETRNDGLVAEFRKSGIHFCLGFGFSHDNAASEVFVLEVVQDSRVPVATSISGNTGSENSFKTALGWLEECLKKHRILCPLIAGPLGPPKLPTRIIDVNTPIRLVQTNKGRGLYACLSHCWGKEQPLTTTLEPDTLKRHLKEIQWELLPKTFQEAVQATRSFGIQYLWIDSLCIIQDDKRDWQIESAQMADIYQNSVITFAGSASSCHSQGLFREADPNHMDGSLFDHVPAEGLEKIRKRRPLPHDIGELPLMHRGWVFQERLLSSRYLHFGQNELLWECMERQACECRGLGFDEPSRLTWLAPKNRLHPRSFHLMKSLPWAIPKAWQTAVSDYSRTNLSRAEDIFPAISGIVKNMQKATEWTYVAGLWREHLIIDLIWKVEHPEHAVRCKEWRAPTFSWASVILKSEKGSSITYDHMRFLWGGLEEDNARQRTDIYANVVDTHCEPSGLDSTGKLNSGHVILSSTLIKANLRYLVDKKNWGIKLVRGELLDPTSFYKDYDFESENSNVRDGDTVFCLKMIGSSSIPNRRGEYLLYLVLRRVGSEPLESKEMVTEHEFERVGLLQDEKGDDAVRLEDRSQKEAIWRDVMVKIV